MLSVKELFEGVLFLLVITVSLTTLVLGIAGFFAIIFEIFRNLIILFKGGGLKVWGFLRASPWTELPIYGLLEALRYSRYTQNENSNLKDKLALIYYISILLLLIPLTLVIIVVSFILITTFKDALLTIFTNPR